MEQIKRKQSSVEWFAEKTFNSIELLKIGIVNREEFLNGLLKFREQAKSMHKEEIMEANSVGYRDGIMYANGEDWMYQNSEHYYDENFGGK